MASGQLGSVLRHIRQMIGSPVGAEMTDGELLDRFIRHQDESAFESLMQRHGPMVLGLCRSILHDAHDADDAYQATFLVLARKAGSIRKRPSVASWLYGVAYRTALRAKITSARRRVRERQAVGMSHDEFVSEVGRTELRLVVHEELQRLPEKYRAPLVLCYLEGKTNESAAAELGWPAGSIAKRLARGRDLLRDRLAHRGVALPAGMLAVVLAESTACAAVPAALMQETLRSAVLYAGKAGVAGLVSGSVVSLADGVVKGMSWGRLQIAAVLLLLFGLLGGAGLLAVHMQAGDVPAKPQAAVDAEKLYLDPINVDVPHISTDATVKYDFDIVYVKAPRFGDKKRTQWTEIAHPALMDPNADLMLLHPDGSEEVLVKGGEDGAITDPTVSFDGEWVYYSHIKGLKGTSQHGQSPFGGADIYKIHVKSRKIVRLTFQEWTPNTGAANWSSDFHTPEKNKNNLNYGVLNMGPCPLPGGKIAFTSNRNAFKPPKHPSPCMQMFVMDDPPHPDPLPQGARESVVPPHPDPLPRRGEGVMGAPHPDPLPPGERERNVEQIGYLNIGMALHPVVLTDGRIIFSSLESQGVRSGILWGLWSIHPDGTNWAPVISAFDPVGAPNAFHFQTQISDGSIIAEEYYNQNNSGFGAYLKLPLTPPDGYPAFGPGYMQDPRNPPLRFGRHDNGHGKYYRLPFSPFGVESFTRFALNGEGPADHAVRGDKTSPAVGKFTHPAGAPDNHLLTCYSIGPANHQYSHPPEIDGGLYLIKSGKPIDEPAQMLLIKNDPNFNEQWPRALVPYKRIYGIDQPRRLPALQNNGKLSPHLPEGTPFGLIGTSSFYKRESYPNGKVPPGKVTATWAGGRDPNGYRGLDPFNTSENGATLNWFNQGADAGLYSNDDIHAVRILVMEPTTDRNRGNYPRDGKLFHSFARERLRILGEIPLRKFPNSPSPLAGEGRGEGGQPTDPDGNPDTSFLARIPADVAFTFQTLDKDGMVLNMAQTWHQLRPGEVRNNCGGCHAHSQKPTLFEQTAASKKEYKVFDLTTKTALLTTKATDQSGKKWDKDDSTGLRFVDGVKNVEFFRDIKPILDRSCVACHTKQSEKPAGNLVLNDDEIMNAESAGKVPGTYFRLALDHKAKFGYKPVIQNGEWRNQQATRYIRMFQARRSLLAWKVLGKRTDGWSNDDFPTETTPGDPNTLTLKGQPVPNTRENQNRAHLIYNGVAMPPPEAVAGTYKGPDGKPIKVPGLSDEDRRTIVRWIDLGCPIDLDFDTAKPQARGQGWMVDDNRPTLALPYPQPGVNPPLTKLVVGMHDYYTGLDLDSFTVTADFAINGIAAGHNLAKRFKFKGDGIWELPLDQPLAALQKGRLTVFVKDREGNITKIDRTFSIK